MLSVGRVSSDILRVFVCVCVCVCLSVCSIVFVLAGVNRHSRAELSIFCIGCCCCCGCCCLLFVVQGSKREEDLSFLRDHCASFGGRLR